MAKTKQRKENLQLIDLAGLFLSAWFTYTVITNIRDQLANGAVNAPASYALIIAIFIISWSFYKNDNKLTRIGLVTLTVLATSGTVWLLGLHS